MAKGAVRVSITADSSDLKRELGASERSLANFSRKGASHFVAFGKGATGASGSLSKLAKAASAVGAGYLAISEGKKAVDVTVELGKATLTLNKSFGLSVKTASEFAAVARARGAETKPLVMGFKALATAVRQAGTGAEASLAPFKELGITQKELADNAGDSDKLIRMISDGLAKLPAGYNKSAISAKLFGRSWTSLAPIIRDGSKEMDKQLQMANKYGATFSGKTIKSVEDLVKAQREAKFATLGLQVAFGTSLAPALSKVIPAVAQFVNQIRTGKGAGGNFANSVKDIANAFIKVGKWVLNAVHNIDRFGDGTRHMIFSVIHWIGKMINALGDFFDLSSHLPFAGRRFGHLADAAHAAGNRLEGVGRAAQSTKGYLDTLTHRRWPVNVDLDVAVKGGVGPFKPLQSSPDAFAHNHGGPDPWRVGDNVRGAIGGWVDKNRSKLQNAFSPDLSQGPLMGKSGAVDRFNSIAARFGLSITSGYRPGDPGYHGQNRARDYSNGYATPQELAFAKRMAGSYGNELAELIHTPLGFGIKNGGVVPLSFWGAKTNAMHYNHVHVALQRGGMVPGQGDGDKVPVMAEPGEGFINKRAVRALGGPSMVDRINRAVPRFQAGGGLWGSAGSRKGEYARLIGMAAKKYGVPAYILAGLADVESDFVPSARSGAGAQGITQFMPGTAPGYGVHFGTSHGAVASQFMGAARYLVALGWGSDPKRALAAYNGGPGNPQYGYANQVIAAAQGYRGSFSSGGGGATGKGHRTTEDSPKWDWARMGNRRRGVYVKGHKGVRVVDAWQFVALDNAHKIDWGRHRTSKSNALRHPGEHMKGDKSAHQIVRADRLKTRRQIKARRKGSEGLDPWFSAFQAQADYELAQAELTPGKADDITALSRAIGGYQGFLNVAKRRHDQATATSAAQSLKSARDARDELLRGDDKEGGGNPIADAMADLAEQTKGLKEITTERAAFEKSIAYTSKQVAIQAMAGMISGELAGFTNQRRATAGDGFTVARY